MRLLVHMPQTWMGRSIVSWVSTDMYLEKILFAVFYDLSRTDFLPLLNLKGFIIWTLVQPLVLEFFFPVSNHDLNLQFCWPTSLLPIYIKKRTIGFRLEVDIEWYSKCNRLYKNVLITRRVSYCGMKRNWFAIQLIIILFTFSRLNQHIFRLGRST